MRASILSIIAVAITTAGAARYGHHPTDLVPVVAPRDGNCSELPMLCTGAAMLYGYATTLTYLCPEGTTAAAVSVVKVTSTKFITVTVHAKSSAPVQNAPAQEPTTTLKSTTIVTEDRTVTRHGRGNPGTSLTPPVITDWFTQGTPPPARTLTPPVITRSHTQGIPPKKAAGEINHARESLTPAVITEIFSVSVPFLPLTPPVITEVFSVSVPYLPLTPPVITEIFPFSVPSLRLTPPVITEIFSVSVPVLPPTPPVITEIFSVSVPRLPPTPVVITEIFSVRKKHTTTSLTPPVITDWFSQGTPPAAVQTGFRAAKHDHHDESGSADANATATKTMHAPAPTGMSGRTGVQVGLLVVGVVVAALFA